MHSLRRQLAYASKATLMLSSQGQGGIRTEFLRFIAETGSDRREVFGGISLCAPRPTQRYMDHRDRTSFTEARSSSMFIYLSVCLFVCYANFSNFATGYRPEFSTCQAEIFFRQSPRSNLKTILKIGGLGPPKGLFCPPQNASDKKKACEIGYVLSCTCYDSR